MMPPAIASDTSDSCSQRRNVWPPNMNASRITYAAMHSRSTTRERRAGATFASADDDDRHVAERIDDEQQQHRGGKHVGNRHRGA